MVQLSAARINIGLPIFVSREVLYSETGWETLKNQALKWRANNDNKVAKMTNMFKIHTG